MGRSMLPSRDAEARGLTPAHDTEASSRTGDNGSRIAEFMNACTVMVC
ncbi:hypothetical protein GA0115254_1284232 [Streptomyces sp. Ncost-T10-10d]|nr:hypothetical protein GA0115254_1284232 [Streptomyces sp. Ncost-T10-10d]